MFRSLAISIIAPPPPNPFRHELYIVRRGEPIASRTVRSVARHFGMPKSSASEQVKSLERRGFLTRRRDPEDERQLSIVLTDAGVARVRQDSVLDLVRLAAALKKVSAGDRRALLTGLDRLAAAADG
ncbi:MAG: MarR family transcriptional regulator [Chloroflexi bacterium]|nr:MAG: MarR family transcriptional regulator [Chloroflexota bacterium]